MRAPLRVALARCGLARRSIYLQLIQYKRVSKVYHGYSVYNYYGLWRIGGLDPRQGVSVSTVDP